MSKGRVAWRGTLVVLVLLAAGVASAQTDRGGTTTTTTTTSNTSNNSGAGIGFGPVVGFYKASDADDGRFTGGVALRIKLSPALGVEGSITYRQEKYGNGAVTARSWPVMVTGLFYPIPIIYGAIGAGWYNTTFTYDKVRFANQDISDETVQKFGWHFGGGLELPLGGASLFADIRYVFLNYNFKQVPGSSGTNSDFYVISGGVLFGL